MSTRTKVIEKLGGCLSGFSLSHNINTKNSRNAITKIDILSLYLAWLSIPILI